MPDPVFSIILPVYNVEDYISACIEGILAQTVRDFELLIVDDGSTDKTGYICDEYSLRDSRICVFHQPNKGVSTARNKGLEEAVGQWIVFCDGDDIVKKNWLALFEFQMNDGSDLLIQGLFMDYSRTQQKDKESTELKGFDYKGDVRNALQLLFEDSVLGYLSTKAFKKEIIEKNRLRLNVTYNYHEDEEFFLRYCKYVNLVSSVHESGYVYFVSNWAKYCIRNRYELFRDKWMSIRDIFSVNVLPVVKSYLNDFAFNFLEEVSNRKNFRDSLILVREFRKSVWTYIPYLGLFFLTRIILFMDFTGFFATLFVKMHSRLKR